jgi:integrase
MTITKRGATYHLDAVLGGGRRVRCSLGVKDSKAAERLSNRIVYALADGPRSAVWTELKTALPMSSFNRLAQGVLPSDPLKLTELEEKFSAHTSRRAQLGQIGTLTRKSYDRTTKLFFDRALESGRSQISELTPEFVESHLLWRKESILAKGGCGRGIITDVVVLSALFDFAVEEGWLAKTPLKYKPKIPAVEEAVQPFTEGEMLALELVEKPALEEAVFAVFRHTGFRCSDVASLRWASVDLQTKTCRILTAKRGKRVEIPMNKEFVRIMDGFRTSEADAPDPNTPFQHRDLEKERVFPDMAPHKLYAMVRGWGEKGGVENCHPHRMRHYFACHLLSKGASLFDVAKLLGDTHQVVDKYYAKWSNGQQERIRGIMGA